jgi:hypothetical protein
MLGSFRRSLKPNFSSATSPASVLGGAKGGGDQREVVLASHFLTDLTLGLGEVVYDYLEDA